MRQCYVFLFRIKKIPREKDHKRVYKNHRILLLTSFDNEKSFPVYIQFANVLFFIYTGKFS